MTIRAKFFTLSGIVVLFIIIIVVFVFAVGRSAQNNEPETQEQTKSVATGEAVPTPSVSPEVEKQFFIQDPKPAEQDVSSLSRSFAERYGSFSNQNDFANLEELYPLMTDAMRVRVQKTVDDGRKTTSPQEEYLGTVTRTLSVNHVSKDDEHAVTRVVTQRRRTQHAQDPETFFQTLELTLTKNGGSEWKVDNAIWL